MSRIRFVTAAEVFAAYETVAGDVPDAPEGEESPLDFLGRITLKDPPIGAAAFLAYALPRREAVWWACRSVRNLTGVGEGGDAPLVAAEAWVREPTDERRRFALDQAFTTASVGPGRWCAFAAGWSSGNFLPDDVKMVPVQPFLTARNAFIAVLRASAELPAEVYAARLRDCVVGGAAFAAGDALEL